MKNELLTIGPFTIYGYGLMIAIGILILVRRESILRLIFVIFGLVILADALLRIQMSVEAKKFGLKLWKASFLDHRVEINCSGSGIYDGNLKFRFCGVRRNYRRDTDRIFVLQDQRSYIF